MEMSYNDYARWTLELQIDLCLPWEKPNNIWVNDVPCPKCGKVGSYHGGQVYFCNKCNIEY